jgi:hypothetical protein
MLGVGEFWLERYDKEWDCYLFKMEINR